MLWSQPDAGPLFLNSQHWTVSTVGLQGSGRLLGPPTPPTQCWDGHSKTQVTLRVTGLQIRGAQWMTIVGHCCANLPLPLPLPLPCPEVFIPGQPRGDAPTSLPINPGDRPRPHFPFHTGHYCDQTATERRAIRAGCSPHSRGHWPAPPAPASSPQGASGPLPPAPSWRELLISSPGQTSPHPLLSPFPARVHKAHLWPLFMDPPPPGARGQAGTQPGKFSFHPSHRAAHTRLTPTPWGATNLPPSTVQPNLSLSGCPSLVSGAAQPVGQPLRRTAASSHPASFNSRLACANTRRPAILPQHPRQLDSSPIRSIYKESRGSQPPARIRTQFLPHLWDPQWGPVGGFRLSVVLCRHLGAAPPPASIRTLLSEGSRIDILSSREETEAQGAHKGLELLTQAPDRAAEGPRDQGVSVGTRARWARGSHSITPTPNQAQGRLSPLTPRHGPGATLGPLPGAAQMAPCPPALHLHKSQLSPSEAPAALGQRSITGPPLPSAPVKSLGSRVAEPVALKSLPQP